MLLSLFTVYISMLLSLYTADDSPCKPYITNITLPVLKVYAVLDLRELENHHSLWGLGVVALLFAQGTIARSGAGGGSGKSGHFFKCLSYPGGYMPCWICVGCRASAARSWLYYQYQYGTTRGVQLLLPPDTYIAFYYYYYYYLHCIFDLHR